LASNFPIVFGIVIWSGFILRRKADEKKKKGVKSTEGYIIWTPRNTIVYPFLSILAGVAAGFFGIGAGMVTGPMLLELGMHPEATSATNSFMLLFTSSATTIQFLIVNRLPIQYSLWYGILSFIAGIFGKLAINAIVKKYKKTSYIIFTIVVFIGISATVLVFEGVSQTITAFSQDVLFVFHGICEV